MVVAAAPSSAPAPRPPRPGPERRLRRGWCRAGTAGALRPASGVRAADAARPGSARPRRLPPGSRGSLCLGGLAAPSGSLEREKGGRARARWAAEPSGPGGAGAAAERTVLTGLTREPFPPRPAWGRRGDCLGFGDRSPAGTKPAALDAGTCLGDVAAGPAGAWQREKWRVWPGHVCPGAVSVP